MKKVENLPILYWLGIVKENGDILYTLEFEEKKNENISLISFEKAFNNARYLGIPIICLN